MANEFLPATRAFAWSSVASALTHRGPTAVALLAGRLGAAALLFVTNLVLARALGADEFGRYALIVSILTFVSLFLDVGYFSSGARLLTSVDRRGQDARGLVGVLIALTLLLSLPYALVIGALSFMTDRVFQEGIGAILRDTLLLSPAVLLPLLMEQVLKGLDRSYALALWTLGSRLIFATVVLGWLWADGLDAGRATEAYLAGVVVATLLTVPILRPTSKGWRRHLSGLRAEHQRFGRPLYTGRLANLASYRTDTILLGIFRSATSVGHYTLAMSFANLIAFYSQSLATVDFRRLAQESRVPHGLIRSNVLGIAILGVLAAVAGELAVLFYLGPEYDVVAWLVPVSVIAIALQGAYQPYNSWLLAHGHGWELRSFLIAVAAVNLTANLVMIPLAGALGAAAASAAGMGFYFYMARRAVARLSVEQA